MSQVGVDGGLRRAPTAKGGPEQPGLNLPSWGVAVGALSHVGIPKSGVG